MAYDYQQGVVGLRAEVVDSMVKQTAARQYKFKQACAVVSTDAWTNTFFREQTTVPFGQAGNTVKGLPRNANFPQYTIGWDQVSCRIVKYGLEENIPWEDILSNSIDVQARTIIRITEGVVKAVDDQIWLDLTENGTAVNIQTVAITLGRCWDATSAAIIDDIMQASQKIAEYNYDNSDLLCFVSPYDKRYIMKWLIDKGSQFPTVATDTLRNGQIGKIANVTFIESNSVTTSAALIVKPKTCATWKELVSLRSDTTVDPYKSVRIRVVEEGATELTDPKAVVLIINTRATP